ncbi:MAG: tetratricopeptide repeat protein [bacterium]|nr:tetratricopeptide repeat protein [bacterium]
MFLIVSMLILPLRLTHSCATRLTGYRQLLASGFEILFVFVIVRAAGHATVGWNADDLSLFYSSSGVWGKMLVSPLILLVQLILCGGASWLTIRCFMKLFGISADVTAEILAGRPIEPWHDCVRSHVYMSPGCYVIIIDLLCYLPSLIILSIIQRSNPFLLTVLVCLLLARLTLVGLLEFISLWLDWRCDRLAKKLCGELVDPPYVTSRLIAITKLANMTVGPISAVEQITAALEDLDPAVQQAAAKAIEKITVSKVERSSSFVDAANEMCDKRRYRPAIKVYTRALEVDPESGKAYHRRGLAYAKMSKHDLAITDHTRAIAIDPKNAEFYNARGVSYFATDDCDLAIADYTKAVELKPELAQAYIDRCNAYAAKGDYDKAWSDIKACRKLDADVDMETLAKLRKESRKEE